MLPILEQREVHRVGESSPYSQFFKQNYVKTKNESHEEDFFLKGKSSQRKKEKKARAQALNS